MRRFLVIGHTAASAPGWSPKDPAGTGGRIDIMARCIPAAMLVSHGLRADVELNLLHLGPPNAPKVVRVRSATLQRLYPDERSALSLLEKALGADTTGPVWQPSTPGIDVAVVTLAELLDELRAMPLFVLREDGADIAGVRVPSDALFVLGDHLGFTPEEAALLNARGAIPVSLGPVSMQADPCITVLHNHLDRATSHQK